MSRLNDLLRELRTREPALVRDLEREIGAFADRRAFGLNFERHVPEAVELPGRRVRKGDKVRILPPRGHATEQSDEKLWRVISVDRAARRAKLESLVGAARDSGISVARSGEVHPESRSAALDDLVVTAEFRDPIYPGLASTGKVARGGDKPFHTVINAENFHALETLLFTHRGRVDCIYIDPPYNTGAKDWKYNNDYVEGDDLYRHSKWLAMMERRLLVAKELLNPSDSVLIATIDEKEYLRLGLLLEQVFPEARIQMVSVSINPAAVARTGYFGRSDEYYFFVMFGKAGAKPLSLSEEWVTTEGRTHKGEIRWDLLRKSGSSPTRAGHPDTFYPFFITNDGSKVHSVGDPIGVGANRHDVIPPEGTIAVWPIRQNGTEGRWRLKPRTVRDVLAAGCIKMGELMGEATPIYYLAEGERAKVDSGAYEVIGNREDGSIITSRLENTQRLTVPGTQWRIGSHDATQYGTRLLLKFLPDRKFPFPKSLYAVEDALRFFVKDKPNAVVLDFFAGSGTTAHAVMRLNRQNGGRRECISITNNEVAADEQKVLRERGLRPGDADWEKWGICDYITKPRVQAAISGRTPNGDLIKGDYKFTDDFPMSNGFEENVEFFTLTYEAPLRVASHREFAKIAPLLWIRAGARGRRIDDISCGWDVADVYGVLANLDYTQDFLKAVVASDAFLRAFGKAPHDEKTLPIGARGEKLGPWPVPERRGSAVEAPAMIEGIERVTDSPSWVNQRSLSIEYRFLSSMQGSLGIRANLNKWTPEDFAKAKALVARYKEIRETIQRGALYRIMTPENNSPYSVTETVARDGKQAVAFAFLHSSAELYPYPRIKLQGLEEDETYSLNAFSGKVSDSTPSKATGSYWMHHGVDLELRGDFQAVAFTLTRE